MIELGTSLMLCAGLFVYYAIFQLFADIVRAGSKFNTPNNMVASLRTRYHVNIRTFQKNDNLLGFAWFKSIWLNENLFKNKKRLFYTFQHERYHLEHNHKLKLLLMRVVIAITPLMLAFVPYWIFGIVLFAILMVVYKIEQRFEINADIFATEQYNQEYRSRKK